MKKIAILIFTLLFAASPVIKAQESFKFGHVNMQEIVYLMSEMDSALVVLDKYSKDLQETFTSMQNEFMTKYNTYQQMSANWTPSVLEAKSKELQEMEQRLQQFQTSAQSDLQQKQQEIISPISQKATEAVIKVGKAYKFTYIFDTSSTGIPYINEAASINVSDLVKKELNIPLDKKIKQQQQNASR